MEKRGIEIKAKHKRVTAQAAMEYLLVIAMMTGVLVPVMYYYLYHESAVSEDIMQTEAQEAGNALIDTARNIYYSAGYAKRTLDLRIPSFVQRIYLENNSRELVFEIETSLGKSHIVFFSDVPISAFIICLPNFFEQI